MSFSILDLLSRMSVQNFIRLWSSGSRYPTERTEERTPFHPHPGHKTSLPDGPTRFQKVPFQHRRSRAATVGPGSESDLLVSLRMPECTLSRLSFWPLWRERVRPVGDPVDSDHGAELPWSPKTQWVPRKGLGCVTTPGSRRSCPG